MFLYDEKDVLAVENLESKYMYINFLENVMTFTNLVNKNAKQTNLWKLLMVLCIKSMLFRIWMAYIALKEDRFELWKPWDCFES